MSPRIYNLTGERNYITRREGAEKAGVENAGVERVFSRPIVTRTAGKSHILRVILATRHCPVCHIAKLTFLYQG